MNLQLDLLLKHLMLKTTILWNGWFSIKKFVEERAAANLSKNMQSGLNK